MYINKLDDIVNKYNDTYNTIKMKPDDVKSITYIGSSKEVNDKDLNLKLVILLEHFCKGYVPNWSEEVFMIKKVKNMVLRTYVISDLNGENTK